MLDRALRWRAIAGCRPAVGILAPPTEATGHIIRDTRPGKPHGRARGTGPEGPPRRDVTDTRRIVIGISRAAFGRRSYGDRGITTKSIKTLRMFWRSL